MVCLPKIKIGSDNMSKKATEFQKKEMSKMYRGKDNIYRFINAFLFR